MSSICIQFDWMTTTKLAVRAGFAGSEVDGFVRQRGGNPELPGEAVKGSIREAAERLMRWQGLAQDNEGDEPWIPHVGTRMQRIFACEHTSNTLAPKAFYKFNGATGTAARKLRFSSTAIETSTGVAKDNTLRTLEYWAPGILFPMTIMGQGGNWRPGEADYGDLLFLLSAILSVEGIGGDQGTGNGCVSVGALKVAGDGFYLTFNEICELLKNWVPEMA